MSEAGARRGGPERVRGAVTVAVAVAVAHGLNDAYAAFLHPLLPRIMEKLGLSIALAAVLTTALSLAASVLQPVMGWVADRWSPRALVVLGPLFSGVFLSLIGVAPSFAVLVGLLVLGGLGSAAFHPPAASLAARAGEGRGSGLRYSFFSFGGSLGYAVGPLIAVGMVAALGLERLWLAMLPALVAVPVLAMVLPAGDSRPRARPPGPAALFAAMRGPLGVVFGVSAVGTFVQRVFLTMEPIAAHAAGATEAVGALMLSSYLAGQAAGSLVGGWFADRVDRRRLLVWLTVLSLPAHLVALAWPPGSAIAIAAAVLAGCVTMAMLPPIVVIAQEIMPGSAAVGSAVVMGLAWAAGSLGVLGTGVLGDVVGARGAALLCTPVILLAAVFARHPSLRMYGRPLVSIPAAAIDPVG